MSDNRFDKESFQAGVRVGLDGAAVIAERVGAYRAHDAIKKYSDNLGKHAMTVMTPADLGYGIMQPGDLGLTDQGLWNQLTDEQKAAALTFDGPVGSGRTDLPTIKAKP